jgi:hypothetical protein
METLAIIALILITMAAYSAGVVLGAGKGTESKPLIPDLLVVLVLWSAALVSRSAFHLDKWLAIPVWLVLGLAAGWLAGLGRKSGAKKGAESAPGVSGGAWKRTWARWKAFSLRMGSFQSRIILSFVYFAFILPFGLGVRLFSDPMRIRKRKVPSHWLPKKETPAVLEEFKRQF